MESLTQLEQEREREYKHEILTHKSDYPELYALEVRKNNYRMFGNVYGNRLIKQRIR